MLLFEHLHHLIGLAKARGHLEGSGGGPRGAIRAKVCSRPSSYTNLSKISRQRRLSRAANSRAVPRPTTLLARRTVKPSLSGEESGLWAITEASLGSAS